MLVHGLLGFHHGDYHEAHHNHGNTQETSASDNDEQQNQAVEGLVPPCCSSDPCAQIESIQQMAEVLQTTASVEAKEEAEDHAKFINEMNEMTEELKEEEKGDSVVDNQQVQAAAAAAEDCAVAFSKKESQKLTSMSLNTALAIGLHNFPEGTRISCCVEKQCWHFI